MVTQQNLKPGFVFQHCMRSSFILVKYIAGNIFHYFPHCPKLIFHQKTTMTYGPKFLSLRTTDNYASSGYANFPKCGSFCLQYRRS